MSIKKNCPHFKRLCAHTHAASLMLLNDSLFWFGLYIKHRLYVCVICLVVVFLFFRAAYTHKPTRTSFNLTWKLIKFLPLFLWVFLLVLFVVFSIFFCRVAFATNMRRFTLFNTLSLPLSIYLTILFLNSLSLATRLMVVP